MALTQVKTTGLADDAVTSAKIADDAVVTAAIADDAITSALIADDAVVTAAIADDAVTGANIADDTVAEANMANDAISLTELKAGTDGQIITYDASGNPTAVGPGTDGQVLTSTGAGSPPAFEDVTASAGKNIIINGAQMVDQRNSGSSVTMSSSATFITDRFKCWEDTDGGLTAQQTSEAPPGFKRSLKFTVTSADSSIGASQYAMLRYPVEGYDMEDQNWGTSDAGTLTLSFWVRASITGTFGGGFVNSSDNRSYPFTYAISSANTWEKKTVTVAGDQTGTWNAGTSACVNIHWSLGIGSNSQGTAGQWQAGNKYTASGETALIANNGATWQITGIQFERGSSATDFEYKSYCDELARCQRYFFKMDGQPYGARGLANEGYFNFMWPTTMRADPTLVYAMNNASNGTYLSGQMTGITGYFSDDWSGGTPLLTSLTASAEI